MAWVWALSWAQVAEWPDMQAWTSNNNLSRKGFTEATNNLSQEFCEYEPMLYSSLVKRLLLSWAIPIQAIANQAQAMNKFNRLNPMSQMS